jgi:hypothetical protein
MLLPLVNRDDLLGGIAPSPGTWPELHRPVEHSATAPSLVGVDLLFK